MMSAIYVLVPKNYMLQDAMSLHHENKQYVFTIEFNQRQPHKNVSAISIFLCLEMQTPTSSFMYWFFWSDPQPSLSTTNLYLSFITNYESSYSTLPFVLIDMLFWIVFLYPIPYGHITPINKWFYGFRYPPQT